MPYISREEGKALKGTEFILHISAVRIAPILAAILRIIIRILLAVDTLGFLVMLLGSLLTSDAPGLILWKAILLSRDVDIFRSRVVCSRLRELRISIGCLAYTSVMNYSKKDFIFPKRRDSRRNNKNKYRGYLAKGNSMISSDTLG